MSKRSTKRSASAALLVMAASIFCQGCLGRSPEVRHFILGTSAPASAVARSSQTAVLIGPVRLPAYLDRSQIATLEGSSEVGLDEFNRWLGGFGDNLLRALSLGLARELGSTRVVASPSKAPFAIDYQVRLHVDDLILETGVGLRVRVRWALVPLREQAALGFFLLDEIIPVDGNSIEDIVRAHEVALTELVRRIANELEARESED